MPNWCTNRVTVSGSEEDVQALKQAVKGCSSEFNKLFSFDAIIPFPDELHGIGSPVKIVDTEEEIEQYKKCHSNSEWASDMLPITMEKSNELIEKYGHNNWYDWCNDNWTCKWDACDVYLDVDEPDYLQYRFDTAWGPPEMVYYVLTAQHPNVYVSWFYDEPGMEFSGYLNKDEQ
jgi:hypothetical protein